MLSRASSDAGTRLRRSKSTSTVHSHRTLVPEPLDPEVAQQYALVAATTAFARAHTSAAANDRSAEPSRSKSSASRKSQGSHFPQRESSFRSIARGKAGQVHDFPRQYVPTTATEKFPSFSLSPSTGNTLPSQPSNLKNENMRPSSQPKTQRTSASSSVASQQIRKARSMYYASSIQTGSPIPRPPVKYLTTPPPPSSLPESSILSAQSTDGYFQRPRSSAISPLMLPKLPVTVELNETVEKARDKYLQDFQQQRQVRHKPSLFLAPFKKRHDKGKKKDPPLATDPRDDSHTPLDAGMDVSVNHFKPIKEKRSISDSLRNKFKKVFRRSSTKVNTLPVQQIDASRDYFGNNIVHTPPSGDTSRLNVPSPDQDSLQRIKSRSPTLEGGRPALARPSSRGSNRSLYSEASTCNVTTSRVTSWSNSSADNTLTQRALKRLTVIHEAKDSISSEVETNRAPNSPSRKPLPVPGFAAFRDPMPMANLTEETSTPVDPKRVFSALMREIDASKCALGEAALLHQTREGDSDVFVTSTTGEFHPRSSQDLCTVASRQFTASASTGALGTSTHHRRVSVSAQSKSGSVKSSSLKSLGRALRATIRTVGPAEPSRPPSPSPDRTTSVRGAVRLPRPHSTSSSTSSISEGAGGFERDASSNSINFKIRRRGQPSDALDNVDIISRPHRRVDAQGQEPHGRNMTAFDENKVPVTPTSAERTLTAKCHADTENHPAQGESRRVSGHGLHKSPKLKQVFSPLSPSIYSRNTDGMSILPNDSVMSLDGAIGSVSVTASGSGSAVILTSHSVKSYVIGTPSRPHPADSTRSSRDWKAWLSHEISELGTTANEDIVIHDRYSTPPTSHHREFTQISEDDDPVMVRPTRDSPLIGDESMMAETPTIRNLSAEPSTSLKESPESSSLATYSEHSPKPTVFARQPHPNFMPEQRRLSSIPSARSSLSRPKLEHSISDRMNERFPFIDTGRRSSSNSARLSRHTPSLGSGSSSSKATPSPKVYSDFSAPPSNRASRHEVNTRSKMCESNKENHRRAVTPPTTKRVPDVPGSVTSESLDRPKSLQPLAQSLWNRTSSSLAQYTTSANDTNNKPTLVGASNPPRIRAHINPITPGRLNMRPKSAFDLRTAKTPHFPTPLDLRGNYTPKKNEHPQSGSSAARKPVVGHTPGDDTLRMILKSSWAANTTPSPQSSPCTGPVESKRPILHVKHSSSILALNKEPSPGTESLGIDSLLDESEGGEGLRSRGGSVTPGQRMADRFLRERTARSGAGSPVIGGPSERSVTGSPAFV